MSQKSKIRQGSRISAQESVASIIKPLVQARIRNTDIQELKSETLKVETQTKRLRADLNRLKERIAGKSHAVVRVVKSERPRAGGDTVRKELEKRISKAKANVEKLKAELEDLRLNDRVAVYEETVEELKAAFLEQERIEAEVDVWKERARVSEEALKGFDEKASPDGIRRQEEMLVHLVAQCDELRRKWEAYEVKMEKMDIDGRIARNRRLGVKARACRRDVREERAELISCGITT
jgi:predicted  nucleic acid-binding Zn-ribbon protein